jgi:hypothetical protein
MPALELDALEARVLGVLIEKELTTPEQYPLSLNALNAGANQKSNRDPVLELSESDLRAAIERLRRKSLVGAAHGAGARVERYRHLAGTVWELAQPELAVLAELLLRGPQMPGELRGRADRMSPFESLDALGATLEGLRQKGFVRRLEPLPGARAPQWEQIVAARGAAPAAGPAPTRTSLQEGALPVRAAAEPAPARPGAPAPGATPSLETRVSALEAELARLAALYAELARERRTP